MEVIRELCSFQGRGSGTDAERRAANLLGNLLCAVAGLLDGATGLNGILANLTKLLNQLLAVLG